MTSPRPKLSLQSLFDDIASLRSRLRKVEQRSRGPENGSVTDTIISGNAFIAGTVAFNEAYAVAPNVFCQVTTNDSLSVNPYNITVSGFSYRLFATGGSVAINHTGTFVWEAHP